MRHLRRCTELAEVALEDGSAPFGSLLVGEDGEVLREDRNRDAGGDATQHPELALAQWAARHLTAEERSRATVYTSGEHCAMCSAAHAWVGLGRIVFATSSAQHARWRQEAGLPASPVRPLTIREVAPGLDVDGPSDELAPLVRDLVLVRTGGADRAAAVDPG